jgi:signal transduction histidine kinase
MGSECDQCGGPLARLGEADLEAVTHGRLARAVTHDLNNLFTCILACATRPHVDQRDREHDLRAIREAVARGAALLALLHELRPELDAPVCDVADVTACCERLLARVGERRGVTVGANVVPATAAIAPHELQQILINLGINAIEAMPAAGRVALVVERDDARVTIRVIDDGPGIPPELRARVLEPGHTSKPGHPGVGLSVVRELVARNRGTLTIAGGPGRGTIVSIELPVASP